MARGFESRRHGVTAVSCIVLGFELCRWSVADRLEQSSVIEPLNPVQRGELDWLKTAPGSASAYDFGLVKPDYGLGQRIVVGVANAAHRGFDAGLGESLGVSNR